MPISAVSGSVKTADRSATLQRKITQAQIAWQ
jgi:hypothetical protein